MNIDDHIAKAYRIILESADTIEQQSHAQEDDALTRLEKGRPDLDAVMILMHLMMLRIRR